MIKSTRDLFGGAGVEMLYLDRNVGYMGVCIPKLIH